MKKFWMLLWMVLLSATVQAQTTITVDKFPYQITLVSPTPVNTPTATPTPTLTPTPSPTPTPGLPQTITLTTPANGATVVGGEAVVDNSGPTQCGGTAWYMTLFADGVSMGDVGFGQAIVPHMTVGQHTLWTQDHTSNNIPNPAYCAKSQNVIVNVSASTPTPTSTATGTVGMLAPLTSGPLVAETGDPNPLSTLNGYTPLIVTGGSSNYMNLVPFTMGHGGTITSCCGPLLTDRQAASVTMLTVEMPSQTATTIAANRYYQDQLVPNAQAQLNWEGFLGSFRTGYFGGERTIMNRVDGLCPIQNPTTAEAIQWAANKWGFNPKYGYTEACDEGDWHQETHGDCKVNCGQNVSCSTAGAVATSWGIMQVGDTCSNHGWPGLIIDSNYHLDRDSTCFNADFFFATRWATIHGYEAIDSPQCAANDFNCTIQTWCGKSCTGPSGGASTCRPYYNDMIQTDVISGYCNGGAVGGPPCWYGHGKYFASAIPTNASIGSIPHE